MHAVFDKLARVDCLRRTWDFDALLDQPLLKHGTARPEQVDLVQSECTDPLCHVLLRWRLQGHVFSDEWVLWKDRFEHIFAVSYFLKLSFV